MPDLNLVARIAKIVALLAFFLPWVLVSCAGNEIAHGTGWQMMTGQLEPSQQISSLQAQFGSASSQRALDKPRPEIFAIAAFAVIALGLLASFALRRRAAAAAMLATSLIGIVLCFGAFEHIQSAMNDSIEQSQRRGKNEESALNADLRQSIASAIRVEKKEGFWVTIIALVVAATVSGAALTTRREPPPNAS
jgi:hypothetical protein